MTHDRKEPVDADRALFNRRDAIGLGLVAGLAAVLPSCATGGRSSRSAQSARPVWPGLERPNPAVAIRPARPAFTTPTPHPSTTPAITAPHSAITGVLPRSAWARGRAIPTRMNRLDAIARITVHHDGMPPVHLTSRRDVADRIDLIRRSHQARGWGDIGYHFVVDPSGQIWQGRSLAYQGAHVKNQNYRNLGIVALGNFEVQAPTSAQVAAIERFLFSSMRRYRVPLMRVRTHRELAPTLCPGRNMQFAMNGLRTKGRSLSQA